jgi:hypothetical protein
MTLSRRKTLKILGGGVVLAVAAGGYAVTRAPKTALAPWAAAGGYSEPRMKALSYAILAPNPHNRQPWLVDLQTKGQVTVYVDQTRLLPETDPFSRQIVAGLGCFLEVMSIAAAQDGYGVRFDLFPDGEDATGLDDRRVAVAYFEKDAGVAEPELFAQILHRRSLKEPYDLGQPIERDTLAAVQSAVMRGAKVGGTIELAQVQALRDLTVQAFEIEFETPRTYRESVDLFRIGHLEVDANPDGLDFTGPFFETMRLSGQFSREKALDRDGFSYKTGLDLVRDTARTGMGYVWLTTGGNTRVDQITAGRDWVRLNLVTSALGLGVQPMSQALQEFPEMANLYRQAHEMLAPEGGTVQMLGRLGYGKTANQSPRWPIESKILNA